MKMIVDPEGMCKMVKAVYVGRRRLLCYANGEWDTDTWIDYGGERVKRFRFDIWVENGKLHICVKNAVDGTILYEPNDDEELEETLADILRAYKIPIKEV